LTSAYAEGRSRGRRPLRDFILSNARSMVTLVRLWRERSRSRRSLAAMNGRELQDIGACRADITGEIGKPFWRE
jgi:uncharacterized protein YjiS (DUF1127 family)